MIFQEGKKTLEESVGLQPSLLNRFPSHMSRATKERPPQMEPEHSAVIGNRQDIEI